MNSASLDDTCTHLVVGQVAKTEKLLAAVAKGEVWILDSKFLQEAEAQEGREEEYDLGGRVMDNLNYTIPKRRDRGGSPFKDWVVAVALQDGWKEQAYRR